MMEQTRQDGNYLEPRFLKSVVRDKTQKTQLFDVLVYPGSLHMIFGTFLGNFTQENDDHNMNFQQFSRYFWA